MWSSHCFGNTHCYLDNPIKSVWRTAPKQVPVAVRRHPAGAGKMRLPCSPCAIGFPHRIDAKHDLRNFPPIGILGSRVKQPKVSDQMTLVICGQNWACRRQVSNLFKWLVIFHHVTQLNVDPDNLIFRLSVFRFNWAAGFVNCRQKMQKTLRSPRHMRLVQLIVEKRKEAGLSQAELAVAIDRYQSVVAAIESGGRRIDVVELVELAEAIGFDPHDALRAVVAAPKLKP